MVPVYLTKVVFTLPFAAPCLDPSSIWLWKEFFFTRMGMPNWWCFQKPTPCFMDKSYTREYPFLLFTENDAHRNGLFLHLRHHISPFCQNQYSFFCFVSRMLEAIVIPFISQSNCSCVMLMASCLFRCHWKGPALSRLYRRINPSCSQYKPLIRSRRRPQNRNSVFVNGSRSNSYWTRTERLSIPFRRSVYPQAM